MLTVADRRNVLQGNPPSRAQNIAITVTNEKRDAMLEERDRPTCPRSLRTGLNESTVFWSDIIVDVNEESRTGTIGPIKINDAETLTANEMIPTNVGMTVFLRAMNARTTIE